MAIPMQYKRYYNFAGGMNTRFISHIIQENEAIYIVNMTFEKAGALEKRPGYRKYNNIQLTDGVNPVPIRGLHRYYYDNEQKRLLVFANGIVYRGDDSTGALIPIITGLPATGFMRAVNYKNRCYMVFGSGQGRVYNGANGQTYTMGLTAPTTAPTASVGAAGNLRGNYQYTVAFVYGDERTLSNPSDLTGNGDWIYSNVVNVNNQQINLSNIPIGGPGVIGRVIFRTISNQTTSDGVREPTFFEVARINNNTTISYTDNLMDGELGDAVEFDNDPPLPGARYIAEFYNRVYLAGFDNNRRRIYRSKLGEPEKFPRLDGFIDLPEPGDTITGFAALTDALLVFTNSSTYYLIGVADQETRLRVIEPSIGCIAPKSIVVLNNIAYFLGRLGIYACNGSSVRLISDRVQATFEELADTVDLSGSTGFKWRWYYGCSVGPAQGAVGSLTGAGFPVQFKPHMLGPIGVKSNIKEIGLPHNIDSTNDVALVVDTRTNAWAVWTNMPMNCSVTQDGNGDSGEMLFGTYKTDVINGGYAFRYAPFGQEVWDDDGTPIESIIEHIDEFHNAPELTKMFREIYIESRGNLDTGILYLRYRTDYGENYNTLSQSVDLQTDIRQGLSYKRLKFPMGTNGKMFRIRIDNSSMDFWRFFGYTLGFKYLGFRRS